VVVFAGFIKAAPASRVADNVDTGEHTIQVVGVAQVAFAHFAAKGWVQFLRVAAGGNNLNIAMLQVEECL